MVPYHRTAFTDSGIVFRISYAHQFSF